MAGLMSRASLVVKSKFSKLLDRAEDPAETLDYSYEKQLELLQNVKRGVADVVTAKKRLELQAGKLETSVPKLESQAREALGANREDLARLALERKTAAQAQLQDLDRQVSELNNDLFRSLTKKFEPKAKPETAPEPENFPRPQPT